jgi:hypothetical protein
MVKSTSARVTPVRFMISPVVIKRHMATREKLSIWDKMRWGWTAGYRPWSVAANASTPKAPTT